MRTLQKKKSLIAASIATAGAAGILMVGGVAFAQTPSNSQGLSQAIASKFNLNKDDVQKVIEQQHAQKTSDHLDKMMENGKITADQKALIAAKQAEIKPRLDAARELTDPAARKAEMQAIRSDMQQWAKDNSIPKGAIAQHGGRGAEGGKHMMNGKDNK
jgi:hypothetical protein